MCDQPTTGPAPEEPIHFKEGTTMIKLPVGCEATLIPPDRKEPGVPPVYTINVVSKTIE